MTSDGQKEKTSWPKCGSALDQQIEWMNEVDATVTRKLQELSVEEKVGQMIQAELASITPEQVGRYGIGSILNGGGIFPNGNKYATVREWAQLAQDFYDASIGSNKDGIPVLWGTDAVHGHANVFGATLFPHNIGLGAARDPDLVERIAEATAREVYATGIDWTFAPTLAVVRDDRWGRTYEGYSEDPEIVEIYAAYMVRGLQGSPERSEFMSGGKILATCKHFVGEGGTDKGTDQGNTSCTEDELLNIHALGHISGLNAGAQIVMAAFNSWNDEKIHGSSYLLQHVLKQKVGFSGFVVSDWDAFNQLDEDQAVACTKAINAGVDMLMISGNWLEILRCLIESVKCGQISQSRVDDAVARILRVKEFACLTKRTQPIQRSKANELSIVGCKQHRDLAREAVRKSLVLLKNDRNVLPIRRNLRIAIGGDGAINIPKQCGGWSLTWQGYENSNQDFPQGESIYTGIANTIEVCGGTVSLVTAAEAQGNYDVGIVVFGEDPYAEGDGDLDHLSFSRDETAHLNLMRTFKSQHIPVVAVFLSGRPRWVNPELNACDAFVVAWLPGTEGGGLADVLFRTSEGDINYDFRGRLSFSWPRTPFQTQINRGDTDYDPLFPYGFGLTYQDVPRSLPVLDECDPTSMPARPNKERSTLYSNP